MLGLEGTGDFKLETSLLWSQCPHLKNKRIDPELENSQTCKAHLAVHVIALLSPTVRVTAHPENLVHVGRGESGLHLCDHVTFEPVGGLPGGVHN